MSIPVLVGGHFEVGKCRDVKKKKKRTEAYSIHSNIYLLCILPLCPYYHMINILNKCSHISSHTASFFDFGELYSKIVSELYILGISVSPFCTSYIN